ncbi:hypothetical protein [Schaalia hyovaginalis]|uniref:hypothetical protein n=1 Tax=Schaalia hyovaginalis TaxID=29316 RepID=UPI0026EF3AFD|nr:hypothetical protein [Schaalia hyovaginalis]MCI6556887.1 hypothetical protein [Schaalia hyovaginalis]MDD7554428.1 hypothetical protein [Schaalia hyovaginalis]MDY3093975.1 hypothetical protein [Schaalia hyovaginalis]
MGEMVDAEKFVRVLDHALIRPVHFVRFNLEGLSDGQLAEVVRFCNADEAFKDGEVCKTARRIRKRRLESNLRQARLALLESEMDAGAESEGVGIEL